MHEACEQLAERSTFKRWKSQAQMVWLELLSPLLRDDGVTCLPFLGRNQTLFHTQGAAAPMLSFSLWEVSGGISSWLLACGPFTGTRFLGSLGQGTLE